ncbi:MAG: hypothetical protein R3C14_26820 [Caldilineaceae bacterium]
MSIGWVLAADAQSAEVRRAYDQARTKLLDLLQEQFPQFYWQMELYAEYRYSPYGALELLPLLELGVHEKLSHGWDFALVLVPNELMPRTRTFTVGVPSSALEVAALSSARLGVAKELSEGLAALALHLLGHVWGLEHEAQGPMCPPEACEALHLQPFPSHQQQSVAQRLSEVADARVEEEEPNRGRLAFYWRSFWADPSSILIDTWGYAPWRMPFRMGRLTAAAMVSIVFLLLGAEAWEVGVHTTGLQLTASAIVAVLMATFFLFWGQNLGEIARHIGWREQLVRTRIVVFVTLLIGLSSLWVVLFGLSYLAAAYVPAKVPLKWLGEPIGPGALVRHAAFMATLGVLAGALGGNLEEEDTLKAELFFDEET